ncbi:hypothetical protein F5X97DRAFT_315823 [Nemania serpens]|nr:hypothetical protein F5X97DRAFT_315823 [Nemania serpens]
MDSTNASQTIVSKRNKWPILKNGLQLLHEALGLAQHHSPTWSDAILISIDFENTDNIRNGFVDSQNCQMGLATLDTRDLQKDYLPENLIKTYNFITGPPSYVEKASKRYIFGTSSVVSPDNLLKEIQTIVPQNRRTIITGYRLQAELKILRVLGFTISASTAVIDTYYIANEAFGFYRGSLCDLLRRIHCPFNRLHSGGNDANFTLRAALLLAITHKREDFDHATSNYLRQIATSPIFYLEDAKAEAARKKANMLDRCRKRQARNRSVPNQNHVRAERAKRKAASEHQETELPIFWMFSPAIDPPPILSDFEES